MCIVYQIDGKIEVKTAREAVAMVERQGSGVVVEFLVERNLPNCFPELVHHSLALWNYNGAQWKQLSIYGGTADVIGYYPPGGDDTATLDADGTPWVSYTAR